MDQKECNELRTKLTSLAALLCAQSHRELTGAEEDAEVALATSITNTLLCWLWDECDASDLIGALLRQ